MIALAGICLFVYQYHLSTGVRFDQLAVQLNNVDAGAASYSSSNTLDGYDDNGFYKITEAKVNIFINKENKKYNRIITKKYIIILIYFNV